MVRGCALRNYARIGKGWTKIARRDAGDLTVIPLRVGCDTNRLDVLQKCG
jgi:hypothetical protein